MTIGTGLTDGDVLAYSGSDAGITAAYVAGSGELTLTGSVLASAWETALRAVTYSSSSEDPTGTQSSADRVVSFVISDGDVSSAAVTRTVTVTPVNDVPVLAAVEAGALAYTENDVATVVSATITVSDLDLTTDASLDTATVTIITGLTDGDVLAYSGSDVSIVSAYVAGSGTLSLSGSVSQAVWQTALRAVTYSSSSEDPTGTQSSADRVVSFVISDGDVSSAAVTRTVTVTPVNDVPVLAAVEAGSLAYTENDAATVVSATITVSDLDLTTDANLDTATVTIGTGLRTGTCWRTLGRCRHHGCVRFGCGRTRAQRQCVGIRLADCIACCHVSEHIRGSDGHADFGGPCGDVRDQRRRREQRCGDSDGAVSPVNDVAVLADVETGALAYTENDVAAVVSAAITVSDLDTTTDANLDSATVSIGSGLRTVTCWRTLGRTPTSRLRMYRALAC